MKPILLLLIILFLLAFTILIACEISDDDDDSSSDDDDNIIDDDNVTDDDGSGDDDNDDDSDDDTQGDDDSDQYEIPECEENANTPPELYSVNLIINGEVVEQPYTATTNDEISISFEYSDAECNIDCIPNQPTPMYCGRLYIFLDWRDEDNLSEEASDQLDKHDWLLPGIDCSSEVSGPYVIELDPLDWVADESEVREFPLIVELQDGCGASSGTEDVFIDFTVHPAK